MKKVLLIVLSIFMAQGLFAQSAAYQKKMSEAKSFEAQHKWVNALSSYYDAMEIEPTEKAEGALDAYNSLARAIKGGKPGYTECLDEFDVYDGWMELVAEYEEFWDSHCPVYFRAGKLVKTGIDMSSKTASYTASVIDGYSNKYLELKDIVFSGWKKAYTKYWTGYRSDEPTLKDDPDTRVYYVSAKVLNSDGKLLFNLPEVDRKWGFDEISDESRYMFTWNVKNISRENMRLIDAGNNKIVINTVNRSSDRSRKVPVNLSETEIIASDSLPKQNAVKRIESKLMAKMQFVEVAGGSFKMGSTTGDDDEVPIHKVTVDTFYMAKTEVTQAQWYAVMGNYPSYYDGEQRPVEQVSWYDIIYFCNKLSLSEGLTPVYTVDGRTNPTSWGYTPCRGNSLDGEIKMNIKANGYRLPTEAEWEFAALGGNYSKGYKYSGSNSLDDVAWYDDNSYSTHDVGTKAANELGIYDLSGNVWEWVWDIYEDEYKAGDAYNPVGAESGYYRVLRGGGHSSYYSNCRSAVRGRNDPDSRYDYNGFRVARSSLY